MGMDQALILALALVAVWRIYIILDVNPKIKLEGKVPGKTAMMLIMAVVFVVFYLVSAGIGTTQIIAAALLFCCTLLYLPTKSGFAESFFSFNGSKVPYDKLRHYTPAEVEGKDEVRMRISSTRKEMTIAFSKEQAALATAWFAKFEVPDFDSYREAYNARRK